MITQSSSKFLSNSVVITGFLAFILSLISGAQFYSTLGHTTIGVLTYVLAGVLLTTLSVVTLSTGAYLLYKGNAIFGVVLISIWCIVLALEIFAEFGFLATQQEKRLQQATQESVPFEMAKQKVDSLNTRLESMSSYAGMNGAQLEQRVATLEADLATAKKDLASCPSNYITNCVKPNTAKVSEIAGLLSKARIELSGYQAYLGISEQARDAMSDVSTLANGSGTGVVIGVSPAYTWAARLTGIDPQQIQSATSLLISALLALWASLSGFLVLVIHGGGDHLLPVPSDRAERKIEEDDSAVRKIGFIDTQQPAIAKAKASNNATQRVDTQRVDTQLVDTQRVDTQLVDTQPAKIGVGSVTKCAHCGIEFTKRSYHHRYCSADCRARAHGFEDEKDVKNALKKKRGSGV